MGSVLKVALATAAIGMASMPTAANAADLIADGITYTLVLNSVTNGGTTGNFTLSISGINGASDTEKGRTGINAFAFNDPSVGDAISGVSTGFSFAAGSGLNSGGCSGSGNFFCFARTTYNPGSPLPSSLSLNFSVTSNNAGSWTNYQNPDFKIDWIGNKNNYDLVSLAIPVNRAVPEPATWALMLVGFGGIGMSMRRKQRRNGALMQVA